MIFVFNNEVHDVFSVPVPSTNALFGLICFSGNATSCLWDEYDCGYSYCIHESMVCDSTFDCPDGQDELGCGKKCFASRPVLLKLLLLLVGKFRITLNDTRFRLCE